MIIIPNYPVMVGFIYVLMCLPILYSLSNANHDDYFTALLPIKKSDAVTAKFLTTIIIQLLSLVITIPFVFIYRLIYQGGVLKPLGIEANLAMFGCVLLLFGIENIIFFPFHYKDGKKLFMPVFAAILVSMVLMTIIEILTIAPLGINEYINSHFWLRFIPLLEGPLFMYYSHFWPIKCL